MITKALPISIVAFIFSILSANCAEYSPPKYKDDAFQFAKAMYSELLQFKGDKEFHHRGFSKAEPVTKYSLWHEALNAVRAKLTAEQQRNLIFKHDFDFGDVAGLAVAYMNSKGQETDYTRSKCKQLDTAFSLKK